jgi:hypothetical protein
MGLFPLGLLSQGGGAGGAGNWLSTLSSATAESGFGVYVDATNNTYVVSAVNSGPSSAYFAKLNAAVSSTTFQNTVTGANNFGFTALASNGTDFYAGGYNFGSRTFGLVVKYNSSGVLQWQREITQSSGSIGQCYIYGMATDASSNVYVSGYAFQTNISTDTAFTAKYNSAGTLQWISSNGTNATETHWGVAADSSGNVYSVGQRPGSGAIWQKFNSSGAGTASLLLGASNVRFFGIALDGSNNCYMPGANAAGGSLILVKTNSSGTVQFQRSISLTAIEQATCVAVDSAGNSYVAIGNSVATAHIFKYNTSGTIQWQRSLVRTSGTMLLRAITLDAENNLIVTGGTNLNAGDIFTIKVPTDGSKTGTYSVGGGSFTYAASSITESASSHASSTNGFGGSHTLSSSTSSNSTGTATLTLSKVSI